MQGEPGDDAGEAVAAHGPGRREGALQALAEPRQPGRAAGEIERVDGACLHPGLPKRGLGGVDDAVEVAGKRRGRLVGSERRLQPGLDERQVDARRAARGDLDLGALGTGDELVAEPLLDHRHQAPVLCRVGVERAHRAQLGDPLRVVDGVDQVPGGEVEVDRARHLAHRALGAEAEQRQDARQLDAAVEVGAGDVHAVVGEDVGLAVDGAGALGTDADEGEVGGAATDVGHEHLLLAGGALLVVEGGRDRLVLELDLGEAGTAGGTAQSGFGLRVAHRVVVDEEHRPADHRAPDRPAGGRLGAALEVAEIGRDDVDEAHRPAGADVGALLDQRAAEDALHRAHQPAVEAVDIGGRGGAPELAHGRPVQRAVGGVEDGRRHRDEAGFELDQAHARLARHGDGRVGGAEIDGAKSRVRHGRWAARPRPKGRDSRAVRPGPGASAERPPRRRRVRPDGEKCERFAACFAACPGAPAPILEAHRRCRRRP